MKRVVEPELLDELPAGDPRALRSRRDLRRINWWMRHPQILAKTLVQACLGCPPKTIVDLGAGDGHLLHRVSLALPPSWRTARLVLVDAHTHTATDVCELLTADGWQHEFWRIDATCFAARHSRDGQAVIANLFLHHLGSVELQQLFHLLEPCSLALVACEPRRAVIPRLACWALGLIGCNDVTRFDARRSVRAGFRGKELSRLWPRQPGWQLEERPAAGFSHLFSARRVDGWSLNPQGPQ